MGIDCEQSTGEAAGAQVTEYGASHGTGPSAGSHHGDRPGPEERFHTGQVRGTPALLHGPEVGVVLVERDGAARLGSVGATSDPQPQVGEETQHFRVLTEGVGQEQRDAVGPGRGRQVLHEQGAHAAMVLAVRHGDGQLGRSSLVARVVLGEADDPALQLGRQSPVAGPGGCTGVIRGERGGSRAHGEEAHAQVLRRHPRVEPVQLITVLGFHGSDADGGAVREQGVDRGTAQVACHRTLLSPPCRLARTGPAPVGRRPPAPRPRGPFTPTRARRRPGRRSGAGPVSYTHL